MEAGSKTTTAVREFLDDADMRATHVGIVLALIEDMALDMSLETDHNEPDRIHTLAHLAKSAIEDIHSFIEQAGGAMLQQRQDAEASHV